MKPSILGLLIAAGAFGASTIYLALQLREERAQADQFVEQTHALQTRIAELERARNDLELMRLAGGGAETSGAMAQGGEPEPPSRPGDAPTGQSGQTDSGAPPRDFAARGEPPQRSEAMQNMMRSQMRANFRRMNSDIGRQLGLGQEEVNQLLDLMVEQQMKGRDSRLTRASGLSTEQRNAAWQEQQQKNLAEVSALIGADKIELYKNYQEALPARQEVDSLSRQLEGNDQTLSQDQRDRMVAALAEERKRVPMPQFSESGSREEYTKASQAWQADYQERAATRARSILNSDQQETYTQYQQWTREMRAQSESRRAAREARRARNAAPPSP
jgi:hypothetical protein